MFMRLCISRNYFVWKRINQSHYVVRELPVSVVSNMGIWISRASAELSKFYTVELQMGRTRGTDKGVTVNSMWLGFRVTFERKISQIALVFGLAVARPFITDILCHSLQPRSDIKSINSLLSCLPKIKRNSYITQTNLKPRHIALCVDF